MHGAICQARIGVPVWLSNSVLNKAFGARIDGRSHTLILTAMIVVGSLVSPSRSVIAQTSMEQQAKCELSAIRDTRSASAIEGIRSACNWLALNGDFLLNASLKNYYFCLVQQLSGVQADQAAAAIVSACRRSYPP